ncbi:ABC transporter substrate-binding protein [Chthonobacter albigriseus]|uniref:ABC transporter substrate-binding protein n=1 Tax=Chthonobacter albigriseus TaxID=1683161 RepID=UPI0015EEC99C|nr:ABC transporter substrate-binding protein [Chthonobacter albigriseus]
MTISSAMRAAAVALAASASLAAGAAQAEPLRLGMTTWVGYGPLFLARDMGFFKEYGVDVELQIIEDASLYMAAVAAGNLEGNASTLDEIMKYRSPEFCFKAVVALDDSHGGDGVLVADGINSLQDIKGKEVGMNEGSVSQFWFNQLLTKEGMTEADVTITNMTADDAAAAFIAGRIPVAVTWEPHLTLVRTQKTGKVLIDSSTTPGAIVDVVDITCDYIEKHPDKVEGFVKGVYKAMDYIKAEPEKAYEVMAKGVGGYLSNPADFAGAAAGVRFYDRARNIEFFGTPEAGEAKDLMALGAKIWGGFGKLKMEIGYADLIEPKWLTVEP